MPKLMNWELLLTFEKFPDYDDQYGPHTQAVVNAFETIDTISWFCMVGAERENRSEVRVNTWSDAIDPLFHHRMQRYDDDGHLRVAREPLEEFKSKRKFKKAIKTATQTIIDRADYANYIPAYFEKPELGFMTRYMNTYLENLVTEIVTADEHESTYYRAQLTWLEGGHFPCGWEGEYPDGASRVF